MSDPSYGPFVKHMSSILDDTPAVVMYHVEFKTRADSVAVETASSVLRSSPGATEVIHFYIDPSSDLQGFEDAFWKFATEAVEKADGFVSTAGGWIEEGLEHEKAGGEAKGYFVMIGWQSVEKHMEFRESEAFKGVKALQKHVKYREAAHVKFIAK